MGLNFVGSLRCRGDLVVFRISRDMLDGVVHGLALRAGCSSAAGDWFSSRWFREGRGPSASGIIGYGEII